MCHISPIFSSLSLSPFSFLLSTSHWSGANKLNKIIARPCTHLRCLLKIFISFRTAEEKKVFVNAIKEVNKLSKRSSSSHAHGGSRKQPHPPQTKPKSPNILTANDIGLTTTMSPRNGSFRKKASSSTTTEKSTRSSSSRKSTSPRPLSGLGSRLIGKTS